MYGRGNSQAGVLVTLGIDHQMDFLRLGLEMTVLRLPWSVQIMTQPLDPERLTVSFPYLKWTLTGELQSRGLNDCPQCNPQSHGLKAWSVLNAVFYYTAISFLESYSVVSSQWHAAVLKKTFIFFIYDHSVPVWTGNNVLCSMAPFQILRHFSVEFLREAALAPFSILFL